MTQSLMFVGDRVVGQAVAGQTMTASAVGMEGAVTEVKVTLPIRRSMGGAETLRVTVTGAGGQTLLSGSFTVQMTAGADTLAEGLLTPEASAVFVTEGSAWSGTLTVQAERVGGNYTLTWAEPGLVLMDVTAEATSDVPTGYHKESFLQGLLVGLIGG